MAQEQAESEKSVPCHARAHAAILSHSCYSLHLCDDICDKKMLIVLRSTVVNTLESGLSFTLVHLHLSHVILRKSAIYISLSASFTCQKRIWGENFFLKSLWMSGRIGVRQRFHPSPRVQVGYSPGMQENRSEMFRGFNNFTAWGNPECPRKRISLLGFDLQMTASSPKPITQTRHSCRKRSAASQLSQPLVLLNGAARVWHSRKSSAGPLVPLPPAARASQGSWFSLCVTKGDAGNASQIALPRNAA